MPPALRISLTPEEKQCLLELKANPQIRQRTKQRAEALLLSDKGWKVSAIADYLNCAEKTVRQTFYRWLTQGKEGLFDARRSGRKPICSKEDISYIEECLEKEERTYNSRQLVEKLKEERGVEISDDRLTRILKKKGGNGKEQELA
jgi:transposase